MTQEESHRLCPGVYFLRWKDSDGADGSVAAVGMYEDGTPWFAPTNWVSGPSTNWDVVYSAEIITTQAKEVAKRGAREPG